MTVGVEALALATATERPVAVGKKPRDLQPQDILKRMLEGTWSREDHDRVELFAVLSAKRQLILDRGRELAVPYDRILRTLRAEKMFQTMLQHMEYYYRPGGNPIGARIKTEYGVYQGKELILRLKPAEKPDALPQVVWGRGILDQSWPLSPQGLSTEDLDQLLGEDLFQLSASKIFARGAYTAISWGYKDHKNQHAFLAVRMPNRNYSGGRLCLDIIGGFQDASIVTNYFESEITQFPFRRFLYPEKGELVALAAGDVAVLGDFFIRTAITLVEAHDFLTKKHIAKNRSARELFYSGSRATASCPSRLISSENPIYALNYPQRKL